MRALCLLLSLQVTLALSDRIPYFAVIIPPDLYYPSDEMFCIHTPKNLSGFSHISVDLKVASGSKTLYTMQPGSSRWHCASFQVPEPSAATENVDIEVQGHEIGGNKIQFSTKSLTVRRKSNGTFIQTDKPKYKPGQKVMFRIVTVDQDMEISKENYPLVEIQDPQKNRLAQWKDVSPNKGIVDLSYQMSPEPPLGAYTIKAGGFAATFEVEEYVLPKFEVTIEGPAQISVLDDAVSVSVSGKYTFGESVPGNVTLKICQKKRWYGWYWWRRTEEKREKPLCHSVTAMTDRSGKLQALVSLSHFRARDSDYSRQLQVEATLEEDGTDVTFSSTKTIDMKSEITKLSFKDSKSYYQPGAPYRGKLVLESYDGKPLSGEKVHLTTSFKGETVKETYITDSAGEVSFQLSTSSWGKSSVTLQATTNRTDEPYDYEKVSVRYGRSSLYLKDIHVETKNSVYIRPVRSSAPCHQSVMVTVDYTIGEGQKDDVDICYLVLVNNKITLGGQKTVRGINVDSLSGSVDFSIPVRDISPSGKLLVVTVSQDGGVAADTTTVKVTPCLKHAVSLKFSESEALPGSDVKLSLQANGDSMCALRVVDKSVVMMKPEAELTESKMQNLVQAKRTYISNWLNYSLCQDKNVRVIDSDSDSDSNSFSVDSDPWLWRSYYPEKKKDVQNIVQDLGLYILSSWKIAAPVTCKSYGNSGLKSGLKNSGGESESENSGPESESENSGPESESENSGPESESENSGPESESENSGPESESENSGPESELENSGPILNVVIVTCRDFDRWDFDYIQPMLTLARPAAGRSAAAPAAVPMSGEIEMDGSSPPSSPDSDSGESSVVRAYFPESWIWMLHPVNSSGYGEVPVTVPDTITEWRAQMFCAGPGGLGLSSTVPLKAFQPFFVDMALPYSVKQGESFILKASVFNYMSDPLKILTTLPPSNDFTMKNNITSMDPFCLAGGEKKTLSWEVTPNIIGAMNVSIIAETVRSQDLCEGQKTIVPQRGSRDVVIQSLLVEPEGTMVEQTHNSMLVCEGNSVSEKVKLELPASHVRGSEKAFISVTGNIMGSAMNNLDNLLAMSSGCGEQNMVRFAPNVYVLQYLKSSGDLKPDVLKKGKEFLESGLQRQLTYKHPEGCYSAFGKSDKECSTWLTAFVVKSISQGRDFMYVDENHLKQGMDSLKSQQKPNGCFKAKGRLLQNAMKGGVDDEVSLTAYILTALLESAMEPNDPVVEKSLQCITNSSLEKASLYKLALMSYAFTLANRTESRAAALQKLMEQATKADGFIYWTQETKPDTESYWSKPKSVDVEMTAYVLLALASNGPVSKKELGVMLSIVRWLSKQQNANGGFCSTQDTVVGIQAMAKFASLTSTKTGSMAVQVTTERGFQLQLQVDNDNRLLLQRAPLPDIPGEYTVTATGSGTVYMQVVQRYHTPPTVRKSAFDLSAQTRCVKSDLVEIKVQFRYTGTRPASNMALVMVNLMSGFVLHAGCRETLQNNPLVKRVETSEDQVTVYMEKVTSEPQTLEILAERRVLVTGLKPAIIKVLDYYLPDEEKTIDYLQTCS
ncbi:alpha-2-macroglobulin-like protein 1 [Pseudophryne corroboree]|uniref:alpha-2-macroglobulin-like protein 1 n=1 Tax=Pseudophryne corroboree TaxID=495146 RepID=UPI003081C58F